MRLNLSRRLLAVCIPIVSVGLLAVLLAVAYTGWQSFVANPLWTATIR